MITKAQIQSIKALADKRGRVEQGAFIAEGEKLVAEIRTSHLSVRKIYTTKPLWAEAEVIAERDMERISQLKSPNSTLAVVQHSTLSLPLTGCKTPAIWARLSALPIGLALQILSARQIVPMPLIQRLFRQQWVL